MNLILAHLNRGFAAVFGAESEADAARSVSDLGGCVQRTEDISQLPSAEQHELIAQSRFVVVDVADETDLGACDRDQQWWNG